MAMEKGKLNKQHSTPPSGSGATGASGYFPIMTAPDHDIPFPFTDVYYSKPSADPTKSPKDVKRQESVVTQGQNRTS